MLGIICRGHLAQAQAHALLLKLNLQNAQRQFFALRYHFTGVFHGVVCQLGYMHEALNFRRRGDGGKGAKLCEARDGGTHQLPVLKLGGECLPRILLNHTAGECNALALKIH